MIADLKPYPKMKDSGVPWLGQVPEHWEVRRLKQVARINPSKGEAKELQQDTLVTFLPMERVNADGRFHATELLSISSVWNGYTYFRRGDVIVAKITPCFENGKGACLDTLPTEIGFGSTEFHVLRAGSSITAQFLYRIMTLPDFRRLGSDAMTGAAGQQRVPEFFVANFLAPLPPLPEQAAIVRFLDYVDRRIRRYIRAKQKLIKLLEELKAALIHRAVTGQIDVRTGKPYPAYKPSGVEWLGEVPEHWEVRRIKNTFRKIVGGSTPASTEASYWNGDIVWVTPTDISKTSRLKDSLRRITKDGLSACSAELVPPGSIVATTRAPVGNVAIAEVELCTNQGCKALVPALGLLDVIFGFHVLCMLKGELESLATGTTFTEISTSRFGDVRIALPPLPEQAAIVRYLDGKTAEIDNAIEAARREIALLREFRTRLIADVVTGKLDVREAAARLPEEAEAPEDLEPLDDAEIQPEEAGAGEGDEVLEEAET